MNLNTSFDQSAQCITFENAETEMITVEPKVQNLLSPHRPSQLSKTKTESQCGLGLSPRTYIRKTVNGLVRNLSQDELATIMEYIQQLLAILSDGNQSTTICFKKFWSDNSSESQIDRINNTFCSLVHLIGLKTHEDQYFANDREEVLRRALLLEKLLKVLQTYYQPLSSSELKPNMEYCFNGEQLTKKAQTILKIKNYDNLEDEDGTLLTISEKSFRFKRNDIMLMGDFNLVVNKEQGPEQLKNLLKDVSERVLNGEDIMLVSAGTTGSGKSETLFKNSHQKFERVDRLDEDLAIHILDSILQLNEEPPSDQEHQRLITTIEGEYIQIFNENLLDLLKKKEKEDDLEIEQKTNLEWLLEQNTENLIKLPIEDKGSLRKLIRRANKNKSLLTLQDKIFERRSVYLMRCTYKLRVGEEEKTGSIVFCELPGTEKLTPNDKMSLTNMKIENNLLTSKNEFDEFCLQCYPTKKNSVLMKVLGPEFVRKCEMIMFSHLSLSRASHEENILFFRSIKPFNESIAIQKWDKDNVVTDITLFCLVDEFEKIRKILTKPNPSKVGKQIALQKACDALEELEIFAGDIIINGFRVGASSIDETLANLEQYIVHFKAIETQAHSEQAVATASAEQRKKTPPKSLNDLPSPTGFLKRQGLAAPIAKSHSSPLRPLKSANMKPKSLVHQDSLSEFIEEISETDLLVYRSRLISEGRCTVCTLKNCQNHSQISSISQMSSSNKLDSIVLRMKDQSDTHSIRESSRERARISRQSNKPKENLYGPADLMESNLIKTNTFYNPHRRRVRKPDSTLNDSFALKELSSQHLDSETRSRDSEIKSRVLENQTTIGNFLSTKKDTMYNAGGTAQETTKLEDMDNKKLIQQLKLEDYHERKILAQIQLLKDQKTTEILSKKENEIQEEKKKKYMDGQKKKLEEMRKLKIEEERKEREDLEKRLRKEAKKKLQTDLYYKKIKQKVQAYKVQKEMELLYTSLQEEQQRLEDERKETITHTTKQTIRPNEETLSAVSKKEERLKSIERKHEILQAIYQPHQQTAPVVAPRKVSSNSMEYTDGSFESLEEEEAIAEEIEA